LFSRIAQFIIVLIYHMLTIHNQSIIDALVLFYDWHASLPKLTDMSSLEYSYEHGQISEEDFKKGEEANKEQIQIISQKFSELEKSFDLDLPFFYEFLAKLKTFGESIDISKTSGLKNPGFTKALISDVLKAISNPQQREEQKIWIILRIADFLKEIPL
jgi:hypothetical protein